MRTDIRPREDRRAFTADTPAGDPRSTALAARQTRTCARCGRHTTFVLEDAVGGWYACAECGRLA